MNFAVIRKNKDIDIINHNSLHLEIYPGSQILRTGARPIEIFNSEIQSLATKMLDFMRDNHGIGLAAPQIGLSRRIIVAELNNQNYCLVNPVISLASESDIPR